MTTGEGGAVLTSSSLLMRAVESLRDWGRDCWCASGVDNTCQKRFGWQLGELPAGYDHKYTYSHLGYNLKMTDLQASIGLAQLNRLDGFIAARRRNWATLAAGLAPLADLLELPEPTASSEPSWFGLLVLVREGQGLTRAALVQALEAQRVQTRMLFGGNLVRQPALVDLAKTHARAGGAPPFRVAAPLTQTDRVMNLGLWVGVYPGLDAQRLQHITSTFFAAAQRRAP
jgi:CDP-6-deoxy-D-xylo-4-hexulose-3-dehydrase